MHQQHDTTSAGRKLGPLQPLCGDHKPEHTLSHELGESSFTTKRGIASMFRVRVVPPMQPAEH
jgi:hypothetical protein